MSWMAEQAPPAASHRSRTRLVVQGVLSLVLAVAIFYFLRRKIDPAQTWAAIAAMTWPELTTLGLLAVWNLCTYAFVWVSVTPRLGFWRAMVMTQAVTAVPTTAPTVGRPSELPNLQHALVPGLLAVPGPGGAWPVALRRMQRPDMAVVSQQGHQFGLSWPVGRAMNLPADESTSATNQGLQQALKQGAGGGLGLDLGGS
jgi:hypothetical protein